ncbi:MAG: PEP-CTERM sorting domain-containing protein [Microcoleaceae cyanobacterium]
MMSIFSSKYSLLLTGLLTSFLATGFPRLSQAATFEFTIDGLVGSGIIDFDDSTLTGIGTETIELENLVNGSFDWSFLIGEENLIETIENSNTGETETNIFEFPARIVSRDASSSAFGSFVFQEGKLVDINYYWLSTAGSLSGKGGEESELFIGNGVVSINSEAVGPTVFEFEDEFIISSLFVRDITLQDLPYQISTIVPFQGANQSVPEPSIIIGLISVGLGTFVRKAI